MTLKEAQDKLNLVVDIISDKASNRPGRPMQPTFITIHNTANPTKGADALMHAKYMKGESARKRKVSWHYTVDDKRVVKHLPTKEQGFHAGASAGNRSSIGIEICENKGIDFDAAIDRAALLVAVLVRSLGIPINNVVPHKHWSGKYCPHLLLDNNGAGLKKLIDKARGYMQSLADGPAAAAALVGEKSDVRDNAVSVAGITRVLYARPDTPDFRDKMYQATLVEVPREVPLDDYRKRGAPILDQGQEGACTGFALAAVANYLLRSEKINRPEKVSARMFYEMARRYDEWPGEDYSGSSARGAMKAWHKHGVCADELWPYRADDPFGSLDEPRARDAAERPLGAYYRVNHKDLVCMHSALAEVGVLYATGMVHRGWSNVGPDGIIHQDGEILGGHAFAIVAYDNEGFWIQNSWGPDWGMKGFAKVSYDDWLDNATDVWVARLGAPAHLRTAAGTAASRAFVSGVVENFAYKDLRPHIISIGNDGRLRETGSYGTDEQTVEDILRKDFVEITKTWSKRRIAIYAHGGLVPENAAIQNVAEHRAMLLQNQVYPLAIVWKTDMVSTLKNILEDAQRRRRPEGFIEDAKDFLLDRVDDALEPLARIATGKAQWDEMKENAHLATASAAGGLRRVLTILAELSDTLGNVEVHFVGHSAGSILLGPAVELWTSKGVQHSGPVAGSTGFDREIETCTLWAPACTVNLFKQSYQPAIRRKKIKSFANFVLTDETERDDNCVGIYNKSLLYLVSNAFENKPRIPLFRDGVPLLGMQKFIRKDAELLSLFNSKEATLVLAPNADTNPLTRSNAKHHGDFDDDKATLAATLARIAGLPSGTPSHAVVSPAEHVAYVS